MQRELIIPAGPALEVDPLYRPLVGQWSDELTEEGQLLLQLHNLRCEGDLWFAMWDEDTRTLRTDIGCGAPDQEVAVVLPPNVTPQAAIPALLALLFVALN